MKADGSPGHLDPEPAVIGMRTAVEADLVACGGVERRIPSDLGIYPGLELEPGAAEIGPERDRACDRRE